MIGVDEGLVSKEVALGSVYVAWFRGVFRQPFDREPGPRRRGGPRPSDGKEPLPLGPLTTDIRASPATAAVRHIWIERSSSHGRVLIPPVLPQPGTALRTDSGHGTIVGPVNCPVDFIRRGPGQSHYSATAATKRRNAGRRIRTPHGPVALS